MSTGFSGDAEWVLPRCRNKRDAEATPPDGITAMTARAINSCEDTTTSKNEHSSTTTPPNTSTTAQRDDVDLDANVSTDSDSRNSNSSEDDEELARRLQREEEESLELARTLMAEEAMASYQHHFDMMRQDVRPEHMSPEEYRALEVVLAEEELQQEDDADADDDDEDNNESYDRMLQLGDRIGDVKSERWALQADKYIVALPVVQYTEQHRHDDDESGDTASKCLVCQCDYDVGDTLLRLPCGHLFHQECIDPWLQSKDFCAYCRQCIVLEDDSDK